MQFRYRIDRSCNQVINICHKFFIFGPVHDEIEILLLRMIISAGTVVYRRSAMERMKYIVQQLLAFGRNDTDTTLKILSKYEVIQNNPIQISP